jgi:hypothetical protein
MTILGKFWKICPIFRANVSQFFQNFAFVIFSLRLINAVADTKHVVITKCQFANELALVIMIVITPELIRQPQALENPDFARSESGSIHG